MRPVNIPIPAASGILISGRGAITYWAVAESSGSAVAKMRIYDGLVLASQAIIPVTLAAAQSTSEFIERHHLNFERGLYYELAAGAIEGSVSAMVDFTQTEWDAYMAAFISGR